MKIKKYLLLMVIFIFIGCATSNGPINIKNNVEYEQHSSWCLNYGTINKTPVHTETYKQCMERFGYKYETP